MRNTFLIAALALTALWMTVRPADAEGLRDIVDKLGGRPCPGSGLTCVTLPVPLDHRANSPERIVEITFAVSFAGGPSKGVLFYAVGGPGSSGLAVANEYLAAFDAALIQNLDIVFFDQRGVGASGGLECPKAQGVFDTADVWIDRPDDAIVTARRFVADCQAELASRDLLGHVETDQAIRDLELFRQKIGAPAVWIYGESYGTQFAQQYASAFPAAIKGVVLDGVVDLTLDLDGYYASSTESAERILDRLLATCADIRSCRLDMNGDAAAAYDALARRLASGPIEVEFPLATGGRAKRPLTAAMLDAAAFLSLYAPNDRGALLRALAAASHDRPLPMLRLAYTNLGIDPETGEGASDPAWFGAAYYAVTCSDYGEGSADGEATARQVLERAKAFAARAPRLLRSYFAERLACAFWPKRGPQERPAAFAGGSYPTLILNADTDPITTIGMAYSVLDHAQNAYMVTMKGGPHVIWGRGRACPDRIVQALLFDGVLPEAKEQVCSQSFISAYTPLTLNQAADAADPFLVAQAVETEIHLSPELGEWDGAKPLAIGCDFGGAMEATVMEGGIAYRFNGCALWQGIVLDGAGAQVDSSEEPTGLTLELSVSGSHTGQIVYRHSGTSNAASLSGTYDNQPVAMPRPKP